MSFRKFGILNGSELLVDEKLEFLNGEKSELCDDENFHLCVSKLFINENSEH